MKQVYGRNVARLRAEQELTQEALAIMSSVSRATIERIENGSLDVKVSSLLRVADALCVEPAELFVTSEEPPRRKFLKLHF